MNKDEESRIGGIGVLICCGLWFIVSLIVCISKYRKKDKDEFKDTFLSLLFSFTPAPVIIMLLGVVVGIAFLFIEGIPALFNKHFDKEEF